MHFRRSLAGVALLGVFAAMAFAGAATGAPAQTETQSSATVGSAGTTVQAVKMGMARVGAVPANPVEKNAYQAIQQASAKAALLASSSSRNVPKAESPSALSYKAAPSGANATAVAAADQPITGKHAQVLSRTGVNAFQQQLFGGYTLEPPDPSVCAGQGFVVQVVNNELQISDSNLNKLSSPIPTEFFFGDFANVVGDPLCSYNHSTGKWYFTTFVSDFFSFSGVYIAVSTSSDPRSPWNLYFLDLGHFGGDGACAFTLCFADQPNLGSDQFALGISTNQFDLSFPGPGTECATGFCGAIYALVDKFALAQGNPFANVVVYDISNSPAPLPDFNFGDCINGLGPCWFSIQPADAANGRYDTRNGGTQWAMSALDFFGISDDRVAVWQFTNTSTIGAFVPQIGGPFMSLKSIGHTTYSQPPLADQPQTATGPTTGGGNPLGDFLVLIGLCSPGTPPDGCSNPGPIQTNDDRMRDTMMTTLGNGSRIMWGGLNTDSGGRAGIMMFGINLGTTAANSSLARTWTIHNPSNDVYFPAVSIFDNGIALAAYTVSGPALRASAAYSVFSTSMAPAAIQIANQGLGLQDGFTQYNCIDNVDFGGCGPGPPPDGWRPRWGDYSGAATMGNSIYFTSEFIPAANCSLFIFKDVDATCGGTRAFFANWGTSLDRATLP